MRKMRLTSYVIVYLRLELYALNISLRTEIFGSKVFTEWGVRTSLFFGYSYSLGDRTSISKDTYRHVWFSKGDGADYLLPFSGCALQGKAKKYAVRIQTGLSFLPKLQQMIIIMLILHLGLNVRKPVFGGLRTTQAQTSLRIRAVRSAPLLFVFW